MMSGGRVVETDGSGLAEVLGIGSAEMLGEGFGEVAAVTGGRGAFVGVAVVAVGGFAEAVGALDSPSSQRSPAHGKDSVAAAIASAQARADNFLASGSGGAAAPASDAKPEQ